MARTWCKLVHSDYISADVCVLLAHCRCAYVRAIKKAHPDKGGSAEQFCRVQAAYDQISLGAAEPHN